MGTRHLTCVFLDGEYKVAQYGQWDGYPSGQGTTCLWFARSLSNSKRLERFKNAVRSCRFATAEEIYEINDKIKKENIKNWPELYPTLSRDTCAEILNVIYDSDTDDILLNDDLDFAADSLFCEWLWLIDLDRGVLEGYRGFNREPLTESDRFYFLMGKVPKHYSAIEEKYYPVKLAGSWDLDELPDDETFCKTLEPEEDEEQE